MSMMPRMENTEKNTGTAAAATTNDEEKHCEVGGGELRSKQKKNKITRENDTHTQRFNI